MSDSEATASLYSNKNNFNHNLILNTIKVLDEEKETVLTKILQCSVCLELPKSKEVRICEVGHHFCLPCHNKMKVCGICRSKLLKSRNFIAEQLLAELGPILGIQKGQLPAPVPPFSLSSGSYPCLHQCSAKMPAFRMLSHLRNVHSSHLIDNVCSNPYSKRFSLTYDVPFSQNEKFVLSVQISDLGLFTVEVSFSDLNFFGCVRILGNRTVSSLFSYQLVVKIPIGNPNSFLELSLTNISVSSYLDDTETLKREGKGLKIKSQDLLEYLSIGSAMKIFFSVWKKSDISETKKSSTPSIFCVPERNLLFKNCRKIRRNRNRNMRRKRLKEKQKTIQEIGNKFWELSL